MKKSKLVAIIGGSVVGLATALGSGYYAFRAYTPEFKSLEGVNDACKAPELVAKAISESVTEGFKDLKENPEKYKEFAEAYDSAK